MQDIYIYTNYNTSYNVHLCIISRQRCFQQDIENNKMFKKEKSERKLQDTNCHCNKSFKVVSSMNWDVNFKEHNVIMI